MRMLLAAAVLSFLAAPAFAADEAAMAAAKATETAAIAAAPEGSTGLCKDGTYTTAHNFSGACASHKGIARWFKAH